ncbi:MAG TPA: HepT-like ribonuclease domain-containing protein [Acetobacteraceae bacterium]|jgi:uncharacterized protein with HEPN domain|nr:HepT-like ribonuclease domain-containing protein [Acetobacteraceae bacterium]
MLRDARAYLWDVQHAADAILRFVAGLDVQTYAATEVVHSAGERKFEIIGEALSQLSKLDPALANRIPGVAAIVAFRNVLIHGYPRSSMIAPGGSPRHPCRACGPPLRISWTSWDLREPTLGRSCARVMQRTCNREDPQLSRMEDTRPVRVGGRRVGGTPTHIQVVGQFECPQWVRSRPSTSERL